MFCVPKGQIYPLCSPRRNDYLDQYVVHVIVDSLLSYVEVNGNGGVGLARGEQPQHFNLTPSQRRLINPANASSSFVHVRACLPTDCAGNPSVG